MELHNQTKKRARLVAIIVRRVLSDELFNAVRGVRRFGRIEVSPMTLWASFEWLRDPVDKGRNRPVGDAAVNRQADFTGAARRISCTAACDRWCQRAQRMSIDLGLDEALVACKSAQNEPAPREPAAPGFGADRACR